MDPVSPHKRAPRIFSDYYHLGEDSDEYTEQELRDGRADLANFVKRFWTSLSTADTSTSPSKKLRRKQAHSANKVEPIHEQLPEESYDEIIPVAIFDILWRSDVRNFNSIGEEMLHFHFMQDELGDDRVPLLRSELPGPDPTAPCIICWGKMRENACAKQRAGLLKKEIQRITVYEKLDQGKKPF